MVTGVQIQNLRNLVNTGITRSARNTLRKYNTESAYKELVDYFESYDKNRIDIKGISSCINPSNSVYLAKPPKLSQTAAGTRLQLKLDFLENGYPYNEKISFYENEINPFTIKERIAKLEKEKLTSFFNPVKRKPSSLESKTLSKIFTPKYKPTRRFNEEGYPVTTIIDKATGKPVEAFIKKVETKKTFGGEEEFWEMYVKTPTGADEKIGERSFTINRKKNCFEPGWICSPANDRYAGIGVRLNQLTVERLIQENMKRIELSAQSQAFPYHYSQKFRAVPLRVEADPISVKQTLQKLSQSSGLPVSQIKPVFVEEKGKKYFDIMTTLQETEKRVFLNGGDTRRFDMTICDMELAGENLEFWKKCAKSQPILL